MVNPQNDAAQKWDDYERTKELEAQTPEEKQVKTNESPHLGVGTSSVGDEIYASRDEEASHDAALAREYQTANRGDYLKTDNTADDETLFRHVDSPRAKDPPLTDRDRQRDQEFIQKEALLEVAAEPGDDSLAHDADREPLIPGTYSSKDI